MNLLYGPAAILSCSASRWGGRCRGWHVTLCMSSRPGCSLQIRLPYLTSVSFGL